MNDKELLKTYSIGIFMITLLNEWNMLERIGSVAKIYNTIQKKHNVFYKQILEKKEGKRDKYSHKCTIFNLANTVAIEAWKLSVPNTREFKISANATIHNLYRLNKDSFCMIYGLKEDVFRKLNKTGAIGVTFISCKVSRIMIDSINTIIENFEKDF